MRITVLLIVAAIFAVGIDTDAQRRGRGGNVTLAIVASDQAGAPLSNVQVTVTGAAERMARTERGRIAFEDLPAGNYLIRFEREDLIPFERELTARGAAPIDVKVTLKPAPVAKPVPCEPVTPPPPPPSSADPVTLDISEFLEKNFIGRDPSKSSPVACATGGTATIIQLRQPLENQAHGNADEFLYVAAGAGTATVGGKEHALQTGTFLMIPRTVRHSLAARGRNPMVLLSVRAGEPCKIADR